MTQAVPGKGISTDT